MEDRSVIDVGNLDIYNEIVGLEFSSRETSNSRYNGVLTNWRNEAPRAVSYTHLDVYKRQSYATGRNRICLYARASGSDQTGWKRRQPIMLKMVFA